VFNPKIFRFPLLLLFFACWVCGVSAQTPQFVNGGFESPVVGDGNVEVVPAASSQWMGSYGGVRIMGNYHVWNGYLMNPYPAPQGVQVASMPGGETLSQTVFLPAGQYSVRLKVAYPFYFYWGYSSRLTVTRNGVPVLMTPWLTDIDRPFATFNSSLFTVTSAGNQSFQFRSEGMAGLYIDDVELVVGNLAPTVTLQAAPNLANLSAPATVTLTSTASDPEGAGVASVQYFANGVAISPVLTQAPYEFVWTSSAAQAHAITAQATDNLGAVGVSAVRNLTITSGNIAPTASVTFFQPVGNPTTIPANLPGGTYGYPLYASLQTYQFNAAASDSDGTVQAVRYLINGTALPPVSVTQGASFPYVLAFYETGTYEIRVEAQDNQGVWGATSANGFLLDVLSIDPQPGQILPPLIEVDSTDGNDLPVLNWTWTPGSNTVTSSPTDYLHAVEERTLAEVDSNAIGQHIVFTLSADTPQQFGFITGRDTLTTDHLVLGLNQHRIRDGAGNVTGNSFVGVVVGAPGCNLLADPNGNGNLHGIGIEFQPWLSGFKRYVRCFTPSELNALDGKTGAFFRFTARKHVPGSTQPIAELKVFLTSDTVEPKATLQVTAEEIAMWAAKSVHPPTGFGECGGNGPACVDFPGPMVYPDHAGSAVGGLRKNGPTGIPAIPFKARFIRQEQLLVYPGSNF
jgi:hypothetical protein